MRPQTLIMLLIALGCGAGAFLLVQNSANRKTDTTQEETVSVLLAQTDIPSGQKINDAMLKKVQYPKQLVPPNALLEEDKIIGRTASQTIATDEWFTEKKLGALGVDSLAALLKDGERAITVRTKTDQALAGFVKPESRVDVILVQPSRESKPSKAQTILEDVRVLAVNQNLASTAEDGKVVEMVTLLLNPTQLEILALAETEGNLKLSLRNPNDKGKVDSRGVDSLVFKSGKQKSTEEPTEVTPAAIARKDVIAKSAEPSLVERFSSLLNKAPAEEKPATAPQPAQKKDEAPIVAKAPEEPKPPVMRQVVPIRDSTGNVVMQVVLPADSKLTKSLSDLVVDVEESELEGHQNGGFQPPVLPPSTTKSTKRVAPKSRLAPPAPKQPAAPADQGKSAATK